MADTRGCRGDDAFGHPPAGLRRCPPHRHSGPAYGYVIKGSLVFKLEGEPARVLKAGETFWESGGDVIHYQDGNALTETESQFVVTMFCAPGQPTPIPASAEELEERKDRRVPRA
ncbi:cupin domain-containing protein [Streptomyces sp. NPDC048385]|uniref:cupin domain-containing protein n=1 Tax=unclassified Streptomyces TaxID=2593676 RepID=UPI0034210413